MLLAVFNTVFVIIAAILLIWLIRTASKFEWAFGDDPKRDRLGYIFLRLLVTLIGLGLLAAAVNIVLLQVE